MRTTYILFFLLFSAGVFAQNAETGNLLKKDNGEYSFEHPAEWRYDESGLAGTTFFLYTNQKDPSNMFEYNVNLLIQDLAGSGFDLKKYTDFSTDQIKQMGMEVLETEYLKNENGDYVKMIYAGNYSGNDFYWLQNYYVRNDKAYVLTYTTHATERGKVPEMVYHFLSSFKFK